MLPGKHWVSSRNTPDYRDLAKNALSLISQPDVYQRARSLLEDSDTSAEELAAVIECDPGLVGQLLKDANCQSNGLSAEIDNVSDAIKSIGLNGARTTLLATVAKSVFEKIPTELVDVDDFWHHSVCCALAAQVLARRCNLIHEERLFMAGLLHDIGQLPIYDQLPEPARRILELARKPETYRYRAEKEVLGFTHAQVGAELMRLWRFPANLWEPAAFHHEPRKASRFPVETAIVHISTNLANVIEPSWKTSGDLQDSLRVIDPHVWSVTRLSQDDMDAALTEVKMRSLGVMETIAPHFFSLY